MAIQTNQVTVGTSATKMIEAGPNGAVAVIHAASTGVDVYIGDASVTTGDGFILEGGGSTPALPLYPGETLYAVIDSGTQVVSVLSIHQ